MHAPTAEFEVIRGVITHLQISRGEENFVRTGSDQALGAGTAAGLVLSGMAGAATGAALASGGATDSVEFFTAMLDEQHIAGRFSRVGFQNGENVEAVITRSKEGALTVFALRRPSDKMLWMFPHCSRGRMAHWKHAIWTTPKIALLVFLALGAFFFFLEKTSEDSANDASYWFFFWLILANSAIVGAYFPIKLAFKWRPLVRIAEGIFCALGYPDPKHVDLEKIHKTASKARGEKWPYVSGGPWVYRYE